MPESKPKSLHLASCIEDLDEKYNIPDVKKKSAIMSVHLFLCVHSIVPKINVHPSIFSGSAKAR